MKNQKMTAEEIRLKESADQTKHWKKWGPYLSDRQWGTVREDYSPGGTAWDYFSHDQARSRAYRWGEDGILGISDNHQILCFALSFWNENDAILKERFFGLTGNQGNHGEDVKEYYFYQDSTPTHSYMKALYKYPQSAFPYQALVAENAKRGPHDLEYELLDTGVFNNKGYFDITAEYAKADAEDILIKISVANRGPKKARFHFLPTLWFRNTWTWNGQSKKPVIQKGAALPGVQILEADHHRLGKRFLHCEGAPELIFTENETNTQRLFNSKNAGAFVKDGFHDYVIHGDKNAINPDLSGSKAAAHYTVDVGAGETAHFRLRLTDALSQGNMFQDFEKIFDMRKAEADDFYTQSAPEALGPDERSVQRQAFAGMLWSKQFYHYIVEDWLKGDPTQPNPPQGHQRGRNSDWGHLYNEDILSMPDKWEYPWFASWDSAFHCIPLSMVDADFAKKQLMLLTREWYMHPNGQIPAYEWAFGDVNPPVHAWSTWRVYKIDEKISGKKDIQFLERVFQKLLLNFTWWVNRKDAEGRNIFQGGFLGLDNISVFDRSNALPTGGHIDQSDGTSWMGMYCLNMLTIALELAMHNSSYEDIASKFFEHFLYIAEAMNKIGEESIPLWNEEDGFFYDVLHTPNGGFPLKVRSMVGLIPLFAVMTIESEVLKKLPGFRKRFEWFLKNRPALCENVACMSTCGTNERRLLSILDLNRLSRVLEKMLDEKEFLSDHGIRSISRFHKDQPYVLNVNGSEHRVDYEPAESTTRLFGGNSNWRGPVWFPVNYLIIESLQKFHHYAGDGFKVECPKGSGKRLSLWDTASDLSWRLMKIFLKDSNGRKPVFGAQEIFQNDPHWKEHVFFYEYFHGDNGAGIGASHQTGWTGLVAKLIQQQGQAAQRAKAPQAFKASAPQIVHACAGKAQCGGKIK